ncbi:MAG: hypothetical protein ACAI44_32080 [Candidatus Sericytochromatia bacterium]
MIISEAAIKYLESQEHDLPADLISQAYWQTLPSNRLEIQDRMLYEVLPDGEKRLLKDFRACPQQAEIQS